MRFEEDIGTVDTVMHCANAKQIMKFIEYLHENGLDKGKLEEVATNVCHTTVEEYIQKLAPKILEKYGTDTCIRYTQRSDLTFSNLFSYNRIQYYTRNGFRIQEYSDYEWGDLDMDSVIVDCTGIQNFLMPFAQ